MVNNIKIEVNLLGNLMWCPDKKQKTHNIQVQSNIQISELLCQMNVPVEQVNFITKNNYKIDINSLLELKEGDEISISPIIFGG
jgi:hypothetical protein